MKKPFGMARLSTSQSVALTGIEASITTHSPASSAKASDSGAKRTLDRGLLYAAMNAACPECAVGVEEWWMIMRKSMVDVTGSGALVDAIEPTVARMLSFELRNSTEKHGHVNLLTPILATMFGTIENGDDYGLALTEMLEAGRVRFHDHRVLRAVRAGFCQRAGVSSKNEAENDVPFNDLLNRVSESLRHLDDPKCAALAKGSALLHGIDLYADGLGAVPLVTCLRIAVYLEEKRVSWTETFYLWKTFTPAKANELLAYATDPRVTARDIEKRLLLA